ncbi:MAG: hypothetical protein DYG89_50305 [Caldilinea sp. CFX5]|nr:hypothetical protein [Caldilinea sp. CFX5]
MSIYPITLDLPETLYRLFAVKSQTETRPIHDLLLETLVRSTPPEVESDLPIALQIELKAMESLSDSALWAIAESTMNPDKVALYDILLDRLHEGTLTAEGQSLLTQLRDESDCLMVRKAHAYALLKSRGHQLPTLQELRERRTQ